MYTHKYGHTHTHTHTHTHHIRVYMYMYICACVFFFKKNPFPGTMEQRGLIGDPPYAEEEIQRSEERRQKICYEPKYYPFHPWRASLNHAYERLHQGTLFILCHTVWPIGGTIGPKKATRSYTTIFQKVLEYGGPHSTNKQVSCLIIPRRNTGLQLTCFDCWPDMLRTQSGEFQKSRGGRVEKKKSLKLSVGQQQFKQEMPNSGLPYFNSF